MNKKAVVIFSGGQDSTTCLIQALTEYDDIHCLTFDYGQRHRQEIDVAQEVATALGIKIHKVIDVNVLNEFSVSSLTRDAIPVPTPQEMKSGTLPTTFVPGRNILFLTLSAIYAYQVAADTLITGVCETDFSGYHDCRSGFIAAMKQALALGMEYDIVIKTPLMQLNKAETWAMADYYGYFDFVRQRTLTCYHGVIGEGCRQCAACFLRARGLEAYLTQKESVMQSFNDKQKLYQNNAPYTHNSSN